MSDPLEKCPFCSAEVHPDDVKRGHALGRITYPCGTHRRLKLCWEGTADGNNQVPIRPGIQQSKDCEIATLKKALEEARKALKAVGLIVENKHCVDFMNNKVLDIIRTQYRNALTPKEEEED